MQDSALETPIGHVAAQRPEVLPVLERFGVDYCCGGDRTLGDACRQANVDPQTVLNEIASVEPDKDESAPVDWLAASLTDLCDHIEQTHHQFLRKQLPRLSGLLEKVVVAHGENHPELAIVRETFSALRAELEPHMFKEEQILFPAIRALESAQQDVSFPFGTVQNPINMMEHEHDNAGDALKQLRQVTDGYRVPNDACNTYRQLYQGLQTLETDLHQHIHKENNILFPAAIQLERRN